jgi:hypothetical protein
MVVVSRFVAVVVVCCGVVISQHSHAATDICAQREAAPEKKKGLGKSFLLVSLNSFFTYIHN